MTPNKLKLTTMRFKNFTPDFLGQLYVCGGDRNSVFLVTGIHHSAEWVLGNGALGRIGYLIADITFVFSQKVPTEGNNPRRVLIGNAAAGGANKLMPFIFICDTLFAEPAFVAIHGAAGAIRYPFDAPLFLIGV